MNENRMDSSFYGREQKSFLPLFLQTKKTANIILPLFLKGNCHGYLQKKTFSCNSDNKKKAGNPFIQGFQLSLFAYADMTNRPSFFTSEEVGFSESMC